MYTHTCNSIVIALCYTAELAVLFPLLSDVWRRRRRCCFCSMPPFLTSTREHQREKRGLRFPPLCCLLHEEDDKGDSIMLLSSLRASLSLSSSSSSRYVEKHFPKDFLLFSFFPNWLMLRLEEEGNRAIVSWEFFSSLGEARE